MEKEHEEVHRRRRKGANDVYDASVPRRPGRIGGGRNLGWSYFFLDGDTCMFIVLTTVNSTWDIGQGLMDSHLTAVNN